MKSDIIKVLIVDDEHLVRNLLKKCLDWNSIDMEIIGEAASGEDAIEFVNKYTPDLIFTDICMVNMDGIQFADYIIRKYPYLKVVVISGHEDFKYAQRSIKAGIRDYILKPIDDEVVLNTALAMKKEIQKEREALTEYTSLKNQLAIKSIGKSYEEGLEDLNHQSARKPNKLIDDISNYMRGNLADSGLSLTKTAQIFFINPSYLSRVFKKETGVNFMDYLTKLRIEEAIILLRNTDLKAYEVAERVGIPDSCYFSTCFKKHTGVSASDYKRKLK